MYITLNCEYFVVKIFRTAWLMQKLNTQKYINDNQYRVICPKIIIARKICTRNSHDLRYKEFALQT